MEVLLIRHGDPDYTNDCLTPTGRTEAKYLADALAEVTIDDIFVSPLGRARETCDFSARRKSIRPVVLDWLRERAIVREGVYLWEAPGETFLHPASRGTHADAMDLHATIPEGCLQFERVKAGFDALLSTYGYVRDGDLYRIQHSSQKRIALFCHKGVVLTLLADVLHWPLTMIFVCLQVHPTGVTRLSLIENNSLAHFKATAINDRTHLHLASTSCL